MSGIFHEGGWLRLVKKKRTRVYDLLCATLSLWTGMAKKKRQCIDQLDEQGTAHMPGKPGQRGVMYSTGRWDRRPTHQEGLNICTTQYSCMLLVFIFPSLHILIFLYFFLFLLFLLFHILSLFIFLYFYLSLLKFPPLIKTAENWQLYLPPTGEGGRRDVFFKHIPLRDANRSKLDRAYYRCANCSHYHGRRSRN